MKTFIGHTLSIIISKLTYFEFIVIFYLENFFRKINSDPWLKPTWATTTLIDDFDIDKENTNFIKDENGFSKSPLRYIVYKVDKNLSIQKKRSNNSVTDCII